MRLRDRRDNEMGSPNIIKNDQAGVMKKSVFQASCSTGWAKKSGKARMPDPETQWLDLLYSSLLASYRLPGQNLIMVVDTQIHFGPKVGGQRRGFDEDYRR